MKVNRTTPCFDEDQVWPPGFRFHPTDEELVLYYLKRKMCRKRLKINIVGETDVYKFDPEELPGQAILKTGDRLWFFFSPRDRKYPNGGRSNRATQYGYWKATGKDRTITCNSRNVGVKKTLVFYRGRAPSGERTDWVMHEYTLDEEELKRCDNVKDYYALYKVYKKSGPGPKNGEQYGAPFREEDWADDEGTSTLVPVDSGTPVMQPNEATSDSNVVTNCQVEPPLIDVSEYITNGAPEAALPEPQDVYCHYTMPQDFGEKEDQSALVELASREIVLPEQMRVILPSYQSNDEHSSFEFTPSTTCKLQSNVSLEVASASNHSECAPQIRGEDFLEINDLVLPEAMVFGVENPVENLLYDELDLYYDAEKFLHDLGPIDEGNVLYPYLNSIGDNFINQEYQLQANSNPSLADQHLQPQSTINQAGDELRFQAGDEVLFQAVDELQFQAGDQLQFQAGDQLQFQTGDQLQFQTGGNLLDYQAHNSPVGMHQITSQLWTHEQGSYVFNPAASNLEILNTPTSGLKSDVNQDQGLKEDAATSRISSALWAFVESIPTTPASAAENPLVNRAFERMSSFSRVRLNARNDIVSAETEEIPGCCRRHCHQP
ncbi:hypothetical protein SLE2022_328800 [Rubroshorea leprosula]